MRVHYTQNIKCDIILTKIAPKAKYINYAKRRVLNYENKLSMYRGKPKQSNT
jgi:hypothetical protein